MVSDGDLAGLLHGGGHGPLACGASDEAAGGAGVGHHFGGDRAQGLHRLAQRLVLADEAGLVEAHLDRAQKGFGSDAVTHRRAPTATARGRVRSRTGRRFRHRVVAAVRRGRRHPLAEPQRTEGWPTARRETNESRSLAGTPGQMPSLTTVVCATYRGQSLHLHRLPAVELRHLDQSTAPSLRSGFLPMTELTSPCPRRRSAAPARPALRPCPHRPRRRENPGRAPSARPTCCWCGTSSRTRYGTPGRAAARGRAGCTRRAPGVDRLLPELAASPETVITNARGVFDQPIAEYVAGLTLAMAKDFRGSWELQRQRRWRHRETKRVGGTRGVVVGSGPIGRAIGRTLMALGVTVDLVGRTERTGDPEFGRVHGNDALGGLLGRSRLGRVRRAADRGVPRPVRRGCLRPDEARRALHQRRPGSARRRGRPGGGAHRAPDRRRRAGRLRARSRSPPTARCGTCRGC